MKKIIICVFLFANLFCGESINKCYDCDECTEKTNLTAVYIRTCSMHSYGCFTIHDVINEDNKKVYYKGCFEGTSETRIQACKEFVERKRLEPKYVDNCKPCFTEKCNDLNQDLNSDSEKQVPVFLILFLVSLLIIIQK